MIHFTIHLLFFTILFLNTFYDLHLLFATIPVYLKNRSTPLISMLSITCLKKMKHQETKGFIFYNSSVYPPHISLLYGPRYCLPFFAKPGSKYIVNFPLMQKYIDLLGIRVVCLTKLMIKTKNSIPVTFSK